MQDLPEDDDAWLAERLQAMGERFRAERLHQNLTQEQVFLAAGIDRITLQNLETGRGNPTARVLFSVSHVLGVPLADLMG